jgi:hypothetical protein
MIRALSLAAALALTPVAALAEEPASAAEAAFEAQAEAFEARMEAVERQIDAIEDDESLSEEARAMRVSALMAQYQPEIAAFSSAAAAFAAQAAAEAMKDVDVAAIVAEAMSSEGVQEAIAAGVGIAANSAWTNPDPDQMVTYGLMAQHALNEAGIAAEEVDIAISADRNAVATAVVDRASREEIEAARAGEPR